MKVLYLDESGDHSLDRIDPSYPVFVLGGVIIDRTYARTVLAPRLDALKEEFFGNVELILHTADIVRAKNGFEALIDRDLRGRFYAALNELMSELDYKVIACVIKKPDHLARYGKYGVDPYHFCLDVLIERFCWELGDVPDGGFICAEKRGEELDTALNRTWSKLIRRGTTFSPPEIIDERIIDLGLKEKQLNIAGLQLADLIVSPIGRAVIGKPTRADWDIVKSKFLRKGEQYEGYGLVVLPQLGEE